MIVLAGADLVLPDRVTEHGTLVIDGGRLVEVSSGTRPVAAPEAGGTYRDLRGHLVVPGFVDVHVHGTDGVDVLDGDDAVEHVARLLPRYGVTAFCPTSVACDPPALGRLLAAVGRARATPAAGAARVLPAHLESNFINPAWAGAQPVSCLCLPPGTPGEAALAAGGRFGAADILAEIERAPADVGIVTLAPELAGALDLISMLTARGHRVSLGHSGATYEDTVAGVSAGARQATHLFNRMAPMGHREPGLAGAVLQDDDLAAELICDGVHVHPAVVRMTVAAKRPSRVMAITDGTAATGLPAGSRAALGGRPITARDAAYLDDGTLAGSVLTMDRAFAFLVSRVGLSLPEAAQLCATTAARELGLHGYGVVARDAVADLTVLDGQLRVVETYVGGRLVYTRPSV